MRETVVVRQQVTVEIDEAKFDEAFLAEFRKSFYDFYTLEDHIVHLGQLYARGIADDFSFIEGYGPAKDMGIKFTEGEQTSEIKEPSDA